MILPCNAIGGTAEVAGLLGCAKQQIYSLRRRSDFPPPVHEVDATPLWDLREVESFKRTWKRRKSTQEQELVA